MSEPVDPKRCMQLNERRQAQAIADLGDEHERIGSGVMAFMRGTPWMCKAVAVDLDAPLTSDDFDRIVRYFRTRDVPPVLELTAHSHADTLAAAAQAGFGLVEVEHVLSRPVGPEHPVDLARFEPPAGVTLPRLDPTDEAAMRRHAEIVCSGFAPPDGAMPESVLESSVRSQRHPDTVGFFACLEDGERVAASGMEVTTITPGHGEAAAKVVALWGTTVLPDHRRRGIQQALIARRLDVGRERGCEVALIESKPGIPTERNAARLGFCLTYTRLTLRASV